MAPASEGKAIRHRPGMHARRRQREGCQPGNLTATPLPRTLVAPSMASVPAKKILIIEDERDILQLVKLYLEKEGFRTVTASTGAEGLNCAKQSKPDLIVLDLMLPEIDGLEVCKRLRSAPETAMLPIIMLTAKAEESDQVIGLELGADDYVTKPFSPKALVARVKALFRRTDRSRQESQTAYQYGKLAMDLDRHEVTVQGKDVPLTAKEFGLLEHLLRHPGRVLTREVLLNQVWGYDYFGTTRTVDVHVRRLKQKIPLLDEAILSVKSLGYKLKVLD
jgi:two-component system alkaline phosphatase synthesis response regulator PhoP